MRIDTISVEAQSTGRGAIPASGALAGAVNATVAEFLDANKGELTDYVLSGTEVDSAGFGRTLVTIHWEPKGKK